MDPPDPRNAATATEAEGGSCTRFAVLSIRFSVAVGLIRHFVAAANENTMREREGDGKNAIGIMAAVWGSMLR